MSGSFTNIFIFIFTGTGNTINDVFSTQRILWNKHIGEILISVDTHTIEHKNKVNHFITTSKAEHASKNNKEQKFKKACI